MVSSISVWFFRFFHFVDVFSFLVTWWCCACNFLFSCSSYEKVYGIPHLLYIFQISSSKAQIPPLPPPRHPIFRRQNASQGTAYRIVHDKDVVPHLALCCHDWFGGKCQGHVVSCPYQHSSEVTPLTKRGGRGSTVWLLRFIRFLFYMKPKCSRKICTVGTKSSLARPPPSYPSTFTIIIVIGWFLLTPVI